MCCDQSGGQDKINYSYHHHACIHNLISEKYCRTNFTGARIDYFRTGMTIGCSCPAVEPALIAYKNLVYSDEGGEATIDVDFNGNPYPSITWFFNGMRLDEEKSDGREVTEEGSLYISKVQRSHAGTYDFIISNASGSVEGCTKLIVYLKERSMERSSHGPTKITTNPVRQDQFGEHVAKYHKNNDSGFSEEFEVQFQS